MKAHVTICSRRAPCPGGRYWVAFALPLLASLGQSCAATAPASFAAPASEAPQDPGSAVAEQRPPSAEALAHAGGPESGAANEAPSEAGSAPGLLEFLDVSLTQRVADIGTGSGYAAELLAHAVGRTGVVYAHNNRAMPAPAGETLAERLRRKARRNIVVMKLDYEAPLSPEASGLDLVTFLFAYHDTIASGVDRMKMNRAVFKALKPGGHYVVADHAAGEAEAGAAPLHRADEGQVRREVEAAGFALVEQAHLLRAPDEAQSKLSSAGSVHADRFILKFQRPH